MIVRNGDKLRFALMEMLGLSRDWLASSTDWLSSLPCAPSPVATVCFRAHPEGVDKESALDDLNEQLMERVNAACRAFLSHTKLGNRFTIRWAIGNLRTDEARVEETWKILKDSLQEIQQSGKL